MTAKWLRTALLGYLAVILSGCIPTQATPTPGDVLIKATTVEHEQEPSASPTRTAPAKATNVESIAPDPSHTSSSDLQRPANTSVKDKDPLPLVTITRAYDDYPTLIPGARLTTPGPEEQTLIALAKDHLVRKFSAPSEEISLFLVFAFDWPDTSLGCPHSGATTADIVTPGYQIVLVWDRAFYTYHTDTHNRILLCHIQPPHEIYSQP